MAVHAKGHGEAEAAATLYLRAGERSAARSAFREARSHLNRVYFEKRSFSSSGSSRSLTERRSATTQGS